MREKMSEWGQPFEDEARFRRASDGEYRWFWTRGVPLRDEQGKIAGWYGLGLASAPSARF